jgi:NAD(P)-dependent dehydrogenase (short-subunit alcohol dehydrogenase family)
MMKDKIVLITGVNSGIGRATIRALVQKSAIIIMAFRNLEKAEPVCEMIQIESKRVGIDKKVWRLSERLRGKIFNSKRTN